MARFIKTPSFGKINYYLENEDKRQELIDKGIPLEVIVRHGEYEPLSEAEALFLLEHLKNSRNFNHQNKEKIIENFETIRNIMRLEKLRELEERLI